MVTSCSAYGCKNWCCKGSNLTFHSSELKKMCDEYPENMEEKCYTMDDLKRKVKKWESSFAEKHSRKPNKEDIKNASASIRDSYHSYWKLKKCEEKKSCVNKKVDEIWSSDLNKSHQVYTKSNSLTSSTLQYFSNKLKKHATINDSKKFRHINASSKELEGNNTTQKISFPENANIMKNLLELEEEADDNVFLSCEKELQSSSNFKVIKSVPRLSNAKKSINILSSLDVIDNNKRILHFHTKINHDWLDRCNSLAEDRNKTVECSEIRTVCVSTPSMENSQQAYKNRLSNKKTEFSIPLLERNNYANCNDTFLASNSECNDECKVSSPDSSSSLHFNVDIPNHEQICKDKCDATQLILSNNHDASQNFKNIKITDPNELTDKLLGQLNMENTEQVSRAKKQKIRHSSFDGLSITSDKQALLKSKLPKNSQKFKSNPSAEVSEANKKTFESRSPLLSKFSHSSHLERKIAAGSVNENFVRINLKKKKYVRGHHHLNVKKLKWKKWKQLKKDSDSGSKSVVSTACFRCGEIGHWARNCPAIEGNGLLPGYDDEEMDDISLPTIEEAAELAKGIRFAVTKPSEKITPTKLFEDACSTRSYMEVNDIASYDCNAEDSNSKEEEKIFEATQRKISSLFSLGPDDVPQKVYDALKKMGYSQFKQGQEKAIMRILSGLSTLVILPTGSGKSLCYQLPAYLYSQEYTCITLVISPLVSLMEDQIAGLPSCLHAVCLHSGMTPSQKESTLNAISSGKAQILLVSPEAVIGGKGYSKGYLPANLPPIAFACIDEAHCLSEWSHNFRPSYLQLYKVLTQKFGVSCILGLTATATVTTASDIAYHLDLKITDESVIGKTNVPENLLISVSRDKDRDWALISLLKGERFHRCNSVIIYCIRRDETERLATLIRTCLQDEKSDQSALEPEDFHKAKGKTKKGRHLVWSAEAYHAGLSAAKRRSVQKNFMTGKLRVIVATVAFGMGIDKSDIRAVIHYNMPKSFESYVQEIGRAGRDSLPAQCHLFLDSEGNDLYELRRHIHANSTDRHSIRKMLKKIFIPCKCKKLQKALEESSSQQDLTLDTASTKSICPKHEMAFSVESTVQELDMKEENILTFLCYLELHPKHWLEVLPPAYATCRIRCYGGPKQMLLQARRCPPIAVAMALDRQKGKTFENSAQYEFQVMDIASYMGWESGLVKKELKKLEWSNKQPNGHWKKTGVLVEFSNLAFHLRVCGDLEDEELDKILDFLYARVRAQEEQELGKLQQVFSSFHSASFSQYWSCSDEVNLKRSDAIKCTINQYFGKNSDNDKDDCTIPSACLQQMKSDTVDLVEVRHNIHDLICIHQDRNFTGRAIARIFHGISSPCFPAEVWGRVKKFWRRHLNIDFNLLLKIANEEILKLR